MDTLLNKATICLLFLLLIVGFNKIVLADNVQDRIPWLTNQAGKCDYPLPMRLVNWAMPEPSVHDRLFEESA